jgi:hypothetical protein
LVKTPHITEKTVYTVSVDATGHTQQVATVTQATNYTYTVNSAWTGTAETIQTAAPLVAGPWGSVAATAIGLFMAGLGWFARVKSKQAGLLDVVIAGVEAANQPATKEAVAKIAAAIGKGKALDAEVQRVTQ